VWGGVPLASES